MYQQIPESQEHEELKYGIGEYLKQLGYFVEYEYFNDYHKKRVDIHATTIEENHEIYIAVECGQTQLEKLQHLQKYYHIVLHVPYCYSSTLEQQKTSFALHFQAKLEEFLKCPFQTSKRMWKTQFSLDRKKQSLFKTKKGKDHKHEWDYCGSFKMCRICFLTENVFDDSILNYEKSGMELAWHRDQKYMCGENNKDDS